jgi:hypothetical protein
MAENSLKRCPPALALERHAKGELLGGTSEHWRAHIAECDACSRELERLAAETSRLRGTAGWQRLAQQLREADEVVPLARNAPLYRKLGILGAVAAAACAALVLVWSATTDYSAGQGPHQLTPKGNAQIAVTLLRDGRALAFEEERSLLRPGDRLQLDWISARPGYLALFLVEDGEPAVRLFPVPGGSRESDAGRVRAGKVPVGSGLMLDASTKDAAIWGFFAEEDFDVGALKARLEEGHPTSEMTFDGEMVRMGLRVLRSPD